MQKDLKQLKIYNTLLDILWLKANVESVRLEECEGENTRKLSVHLEKHEIVLTYLLRCDLERARMSVTIMYGPVGIQGPCTDEWALEAWRFLRNEYEEDERAANDEHHRQSREAFQYAFAKMEPLPVGKE